MTPERWRQVTEVFHAALVLDAPARAAYLDRACAGDHGLREEINAMLAAHHTPAGFGDRPVIGAIDGTRRLETGTVVGAYRIDRLIGSGGMADVYRARDTRLGRDVAIKVLPEVFTADPERSARFEREARLLAALNHPHIAHIYDVEKSPGTYALVMELVEGPTLADRIARGPIPVDEALGIARQIAEALEAAHEQGIIHRDLKPANIKVRPDGTVKVLDLGVAKALEPVSLADVNATASPTVTSPAMMTGVGVLLGTAAYMSPEQARGKPVDNRSDIWAFGCVLYEMLAGRRAFDGEDVAETLALLVAKEPDWSILPLATPTAIRVLLKGCLDKKSRERVADISTVRFVLKEHVHLTPPAAVTPIVLSPRRPLWRRVAPAAGAALLAGAAATALTWVTMRPDPPRVVRTGISTSGSTALAFSGADRDIAITQDGSRIVYRGINQLLVRGLDQPMPTALTGLGFPHGPFLSPDAQWVGFFDGNTRLKKVAITGGPSVTVTTVNGAIFRGGTWTENDTIIFATGDAGQTGLLQVAAAGGEPTVLTKPDPGRNEHQWPESLPGGRAVLFTIQPLVGGPENAQIAVLDLRTRTQTVLVRGGSHAFYVPSGHLVYGAEGTLRAVPFDLTRLAVIGTPVPVLERMATTTSGAVDAMVGANGTLVYLSSSATAGVTTVQRSLVWVDRQGREELLPAPPRMYRGPRLSPDGTRVAVGRDDEESDLWLYDLARATLTRLTTDLAGDTTPVWTPDGRRLVFASTRGGGQNVYIQAADGIGSAVRLTDSPNIQAVTDITADSTRVLVSENRRDLGFLTLPPSLLGSPVSPGASAAAVGKVEPLIATRFEERWGVVSPGGRWMAYESNSSGRFEIYVRPFPAVDDGQWLVSTGGGVQALWARNGRELFYVAPDGSLMTVPVDARNPTWQAGTPSKLFSGPYYIGNANQVGRHYDVTADGRRFLMIKEGGGNAAAPENLIVIQNWFEELKRLVPTN